MYIRIKHIPTYKSAISLLIIYSRAVMVQVHMKMCTWVLITASFIRDCKQRWRKCPSVDEQNMNTTWQWKGSESTITRHKRVWFYLHKILENSNQNQKPDQWLPRKRLKPEELVAKGLEEPCMCGQYIFWLWQWLHRHIHRSVKTYLIVRFKGCSLLYGNYIS